MVPASIRGWIHLVWDRPLEDRKGDFHLVIRDVGGHSSSSTPTSSLSYPSGLDSIAGFDPVPVIRPLVRYEQGFVGSQVGLVVIQLYSIDWIGETSGISDRFHGS